MSSGRAEPAGLVRQVPWFAWTTADGTATALYGASNDATVFLED